MSWWCPKSGTKNETKSAANVNLASSPFFFSKSRNIFIAMGCGNMALFGSSDGTIGGCMSVCKNDTIQTNNSSCNGIDCCKTTIPFDLNVFTAGVSGKFGKFKSAKDCNYGSLVDKKWFEENVTNQFEVKKMSQVPVVINWEINETLSSLVMETNSSHSTCRPANGSSLLGNMSTTFTCTCDSGFEGNSYLVDGCQDIDECVDLELCSFYDLRYDCVNVLGGYYCDTVSVSDRKSRNKIIIIGISTGIGLLFLFIGGWWSYKVVKERKNIKRKEKFFKRNGGLLLQQQLSSSDVTVEKTTKLFNSKDLEKATDNFNVNRILGQGGQGTVYKGMLTDGKIVAIKKSKNNLFDIIDARVMKDAKQEEIIVVANLAKMCLNMKGKKRPTMKEVAMQLEAVQTLQKSPNVQ
ncbi:wall-associated receptor kinase-like 1 [Quercus suber]|uniref:Wall-associated receptor kinase-like 1 n=1 Tax=Quercus suber TaxID=58331 RepID=A0AAW0JTJ9_QUESU